MTTRNTHRSNVAMLLALPVVKYKTPVFSRRPTSSGRDARQQSIMNSQRIWQIVVFSQPELRVQNYIDCADNGHMQ